MEIFYWHGPFGNFGDDLNEWLWDDVLPGWRDWPSSRKLVGVGSLLTTRLLDNDGKYLVLGTGAGYGSAPQLASDHGWDIRFVRGPRSAKAIGLPPEKALTDAAALAPRLKRFERIAAHGEVAFVPHWQSEVHPDHDWADICLRAGITHVSPCGNAETIIRNIAGARLVLTESLHGAVIADSFRVPWRAVRSGVGGFNQFKWQDWTDGLQMELEVTEVFRVMPAFWRVRQKVRNAIRGSANAALPATPAAPQGPSRENYFPTAQEYLAGVKRRRGGGRMAALSDRARRAEATWSLQRLANQRGALSPPGVLDRHLDRLEKELEAVARDYSGA